MTDLNSQQTTVLGLYSSVVAFIASLEVSSILSVGSFLIAIGMFLMNWHYRKKEYQLKKIRLEHDIGKDIDDA